MKTRVQATWADHPRPDGRFVLLVVDDDEHVGTELVDLLGAYRVHGYFFAHAAEALLAAGSLSPGAALVSAGLTSMSSTDLVQVLSGRAGIATIVGVGDDDGPLAADVLRAGARMCVRRPYRVEEVVPILRALQPDCAGVLDPPVELGGLRADPASMEVRLDGRQVVLPQKEFRLLYYFMTHAERTVTREQLLSAVWEDLTEETSNTLTVHIKRLRKRLLTHAGNPPSIVTVRGLGYRFIPYAGVTGAETSA